MKEFTKREKVEVFVKAVKKVKQYIIDEEMEKYGEIISEPELLYYVHDDGETVIVDGDLYEMCFDGYSWWANYKYIINDELKKVDTYIDHMGGGEVLL